MKTKVVLWGENASNEKILLAMELLERDNKVMLYVFPLEVATEDFYQSLLDLWREGKHVDFPQPHQVIERPLSVSESLLPEDIKVERTDLISRAQAEWHFVVLSAKLYEMYKSELDELKDKIDKLSDYDDKLWADAKGFWTKVQDQVKEQNLFKEHSAILKERTNILFDKLKDLKKNLQNEFEKTSAEVSAKFMEEIKEIEEKLEKGLGLKPLFEQMKSIQEKYYKAQMTKDDRKNVWDRLDGTFKALKDKKPAGGGGGNREYDKSRLQARYDGLVDTIGKMEKSILRDKQDLEFQVKKIEQTDGQLEMQIRKAKLKMLEERINSKNEKLQDMYKVKKELEDRRSKDEQRRVVEEKRNEAKEVVKQKIASGIEAAKEERETMADLLENAATRIKESKGGKKPSMLDNLKESITETFEDVVDTVKAVAEVAEDKIESAVDALDDKMDVAEDKVESMLEAVGDKLGITKEKLQSVADAVEEKMDIIEDKVEDVIDSITSSDKDKDSEKEA
jgi:chromosome segregation ATPase